MSKSVLETPRSPPEYSAVINQPKPPVTDFLARTINEETFDFNGWKIFVTKSPILPSNCYCNKKDGHGHSQQQQQLQEIGENSSGGAGTRVNNSGLPSAATATVCQVCRFERELPLRHLPEMVFPDNILRLVYESVGFVLEFNTFDALKQVNSTTSSSITVACSENWKASKLESGLPINEILTPYDWTYSTDYTGTIKSNLSLSQGEARKEPQIITNSQEKIDLEKLKQRENILFYQELQLYEDELHDNGVSNLSVKIRVMQSGFFILQRFFLRVDHVIIKICDTRIYYEIGNSYFLRQFQIREQNYAGLIHLEPQVFTDPNVLYSHLPIVGEFNEKIQFKDS